MSSLISPLDSFRMANCYYCYKKSAQILYSTKELDRRVSFCSMKCLQCYNIKQQLGQRKPIVAQVKEVKK